MKAKTIALIDDDDGPILYYEMALEDSGFEVVRLKRFKDALAYVRQPSSNPDMWIIDVMMPIEDDTLVVDGVAVAESTSMGLGAGLLLYRKIKELHPEARAMLLTSISTPKLLDDIEHILRGEDTCEAKLNVLPSDLVRAVNARLG